MGVSSSNTLDTTLSDHFIELSESLGDMLNTFALPNENPIVFKGTFFEVKS